MRRLRRARLFAAVALLAVATTGCAAQWAFRKGQSAADQGDWDLAVARYTSALEKSPRNIRYKISLENARVQASRFHCDEAKKHLAANDLEKAREELEIATKYDPSNRSAADDLALVQKRIRNREEEKRDRDSLEEKKVRAATRLPVPALSPRSPVPITLRFEDASLQKIFESLGRIAGVNILFDEGFRDKKSSINLTGVTFQEALDRLTFVNRLFYKVLDQNTLIVVPESRQKRVAYDELVLRTFYVQNAEINDTVNLVKTLGKVTTVAGNVSLNAITVLGTLDQMAIAERVIEANDKARGEVLVEVQILEVNRTQLKQWGIALANYQVGATLDPTGGADAAINTESKSLDIRAHLLSSLNQADWVVSVPSQIFSQFLQTDATVRILAAPRLRAAEGKKATLKIGKEVPIVTTSFTLGYTGTPGVGGGYPATSFQYRNVGVNLDFTPKVAASGDITLELAAEFSLLGENVNVGSKVNELNVPTFLTRNVTATLRLRDGETGLIGGLLQGREASSFGGLLGTKDIPIIGKLFGGHKKEQDESEVIISITPRIVRGPKVTEEDLVPLSVGTQEVPKVEGARPPLFGPEPEPAAEKPASPPPAPGKATRPLPQTAPTAPAPPASAPPAAPDPAAEPPVAIPPPPGAFPATGEPAESVPSAPPSVAPSLPAEATPAPPGTAVEAAAPPPGPAPQAAPVSPVTVLLSPPEVALRVGQAGGLAVVLIGARDLQSVEIALTWDATLAEITDVSAGSLLTLDGSPVSAERALEGGRARVRLSRSTGATGAGAVAAVTFKGLRAGSGTLVVASVVVGRAGGTEQATPPTPGRLVVAP